MKDILIISQYTGVPRNKGNGRFTYIAEKLSDLNVGSVEYIASSFHHVKKEQQFLTKEDKDMINYKMTLLDEPGYAKNVCIKRFYSHWILSKNLKKYLNSRSKPSVIYCAVPSLDVAYTVAKYAKKNNVRFIIDIQDLWPEAFKMVFNVPFVSNMIFAPMNRIANYIYGQADEIVAVSDTYCRRAISYNKKCKEGHTIFLGTELKKFDKNVEKNCIELDKSYFNIGYCGTLGHSYDIRCVIDAIVILQKKYNINNIKFIVMGDGPLRQTFEGYANDKKINVEFTGRLEYAKMCARLAACDVAVNPISHGAAQSIINKHADYAAAGIPVISTQECEEYRNLVDQYDMGFNCNNNDAEDLSEKIRLLMENANLRKAMGRNARKCAEERFDRLNSYSVIYELISSELKKENR